MRLRFVLLLVGVAVPVAGSSPAAAAPTPRALAAVIACRAEPDNAKRLACYDAAVGPFTDAVAKGDVKVLDREEVRQTRRALFGFQLPQLPFFGGDDSVRDTPAEIDTTLTAARDIGRGNWMLTMADGAVWNTSDPLPRDPRAGAAVKLKAGALGSYFVTVGSMRSVRAVRVR